MNYVADAATSSGSKVRLHDSILRLTVAPQVDRSWDFDMPTPTEDGPILSLTSEPDANPSLNRFFIERDELATSTTQIAPRSYLRAIWTLFRESLLRPFETTVIDLDSGDVVANGAV